MNRRERQRLSARVDREIDLVRLETRWNFACSIKDTQNNFVDYIVTCFVCISRLVLRI